VGPLVAGLDLGTSGIRLGVFDRNGRLIANEQRAYPAADEQDAEAWYVAAVDCLERVRDLPITALGIGGQGPTLVATDEALRPVAPALTWLDNRATQHADRLTRLIGRDVRESIVPRALWLQEQAPDVFARARWLFSAWDYLASRLVRRPVSLLETPCDVVLASGLPADIFPPYVQPPAILGQWTDVTIVGCFVDSFNGLVGTGVQRPGQGCLNAGNSGTITVLCPAEQSTIEVFGRPAASRLVASTGTILDSLARLLGPPVNLDSLIEEAAESPPGANGLVCLPYVTGGRPPLIPEGAIGRFTGVRLHHTRADLVRAALEGSAFTFKLALDDLIGVGIAIDELRICGGQARSPLWNEIKASALGRELGVPAVVDSAVLGCALLGGIAAGQPPTLEEAIERMVHVHGSVSPRWDYTEAFDRWRTEFDALTRP
jgi:xylulokinase